VKLGMTTMALAALLGFTLSLSPAAQAQQAPVPDAPAPQAPKPLTDMGPITPGLGAGTETATSTTDSPSQPGTASTTAPTPDVKDVPQTTPPEMASPEEIGTKLRIEATYVEVPVTVKDSKGHQVAGLDWRDFKVYENNSKENIRFFTTDAYPLSVAFVVDQSLTSDVMAKVNQSLNAIQGALTPYDEIAIFTYGNGAHMQTTFTGAQSDRVPFALSMTKSAGSEIEVPVNSGVFAGCPIIKNGDCADPTIQEGRSVGSGTNPMNIPKEIHTLNDAILAAGKELQSRPKGRRRVIYVISDGKEAGSKASYKEVIKFLATNQIAVYGTLVGTSAGWGEGYLSRVHLPFTMYENLLYKYVAATGGQADSERGTNGIEKSYADIANDARNQYTLVYASHESILDSKYRKIDVRVDRPGLDVTAKPGYYPTAQKSE
jgi:VWFA-related protein